MDYRSVIESKYNRQNWQALLYDIFRNKVQFWQQPQSVPVDKDMAKRALYTGKITLPDGHVIAIYEVELSDSVIIERNRAGIRNLLLSSWRGMGCSGAFMFCFRQNEAVLRFSYVSESFAFAEDGSLTKESTDTKRFTYLLGEGHRSRTAIMQFEDLKKSALDLKAITKAFSVEALSDLFFKEYKKQYEDIIEFITGKRMVKVANKWEEQVTGQPCREIMQEFSQFPDAEKAVRDYVKKLMGRLVFIQFLQKKGWMGCSAGESWNDGDKEFVQNLFANTTHKNTFVDDVLEPLFNDINTKRTGDITSSPNVGTGIKIPYLNGGLFEKDDYDKTNFQLPAKYMKNLLDFFASYNFTIDENDPDDAEIGVDPEMLGRIFENLLEDNKDKGAFYTPKEIVQYMCRESLIAYLQTDVNDNQTKDAIRQFVTTYDAAVLSEELKESVDQKLKDVKICDPAIGSGAFPMGLLRELYACRKAIEGIDEETAVSIKTHIIQNNIYGVDIEKGAVDIARLRFWLALIVDERNPHALPNMDFKIMQGNSLLEQYEGVELSGMSLDEQKKRKTKKGQAWQATLAFDEQDALDNIQHAIKEYYLTDDHKSKLNLRGIINENVRSYIINLKGCTPDVQHKIEELPIPNDQFFLWHIYFKEVFDKGGFDIVIGNPPYGASLSFEIKDIYKRLFSNVHMRTPDTFNYFISHGFNLLCDGGIITYIVPNTLLSQNEYEKTRVFLSQTKCLDKVINIGENVFDDAVVPTCIFLSSNKTESKYVIKYADYKEIETKDIKWGEKIYNIPSNLLNEIPGHVIGVDIENSMILNKVSSLSVKIDDIAFEMAAGISTGCNKAFCVTESQIIEKQIEKGVLKPLLIGRDIDKYSICWDNQYIIYTTKNTNIELFPMAKAFAFPYKEKLDKRRETKKGMIPWWALNWPRYEELFTEEKIIMRQTSDTIRATYDDNAYFPLNSILTLKLMKDCGYDYKFVLGVLNCSLNNFIYQCISQEKGRAFAEVKPINVRKLYVPKLSYELQEPIINLVDSILTSKKANPLADTTVEEREIDRLVYDIYGLNETEIKIVEGTK